MFFFLGWMCKPSPPSTTRCTSSAGIACCANPWPSLRWRDVSKVELRAVNGLRTMNRRARRQATQARSTGHPRPDDDGDMAIMKISHGEERWVRHWLAENPKRVNARLGQFGLPGLAVAAMEGHAHVVKIFFKHGVDVNLPSNMGVTPLKSASAKGHAKIVQSCWSSKRTPPFAI